MVFNASVNQTVVDFYNNWYGFFLARYAKMSYVANVIDFESTIPGTDTISNTGINPLYDKSPDYYSLRLIKDTPAPSTFSDWHLGSFDEMFEMAANLFEFGVGNLLESVQYWIWWICYVFRIKI
jgi:hypothetical protein